MSTSPQTILMLHGAWHGPWFWENWIPFFEQAGYTVVAPQLPGSYDNFKNVKFTDLLQAAEDIVASLPEPPILIGHSLGGYVVQHLLSRQKYPAAVLMSSIPHSGFPAKMMTKRMAHPLRSVKAGITNDLRQFFPSETEVRNELFSADTSQQVIDNCFTRLGHASLSLFLSAQFNRPKLPVSGTPALLLAAEGDANIPFRHQQKLAQRLNGKLLHVPGGHDMALDTSWQKASEITLVWLRQL